MKNSSIPPFDVFRVRQIREYRQLSQAFVANSLGISQSSYNDIEQGKTKLKAETIPLLAECLNVDIRCIFETGYLYNEALSLVEEKRQLEQKCERLFLENTNLSDQLNKYRLDYQDYKIQSNDLLENLTMRLRQKKFAVNLLLTSGSLIIYFHIVKSFLTGINPF